jgi:hypothetical protein
MIDSVLEVLASNSEAATLFDQFCDFHLVEDGEEDRWFRTTTSHELIVFGADASGGRFALAKTRTGDSLGVMYVSSEGQAGVIASSIPDALVLMIVFPYWNDCLKFSGGGLLAEMLRVQPLLEHDLATEFSEIQRVRDQLLTTLGLQSGSNHLRSLHELAFAPDSPKVAAISDGWEFSGLEGSFVLESNPGWRGR